MRIAAVTCVYPPYRGGIGHAAQRQAALLSELGHEVDVYCPASGGPAGTDVVDGRPWELAGALVAPVGSA